MNQQSVFQQFGHITVFFSTLDFFVTLFIIEIVSVEYKASKQPLNDYTTLGKKLRLIQNLSETDVIAPEVLVTVKQELDEAISVANERNRFMHDQWVFDPTTLEKGIINRMAFVDLKNWKTNSSGKIPYSEADLQSLQDRIASLQELFVDALNKVKSISLQS